MIDFYGDQSRWFIGVVKSNNDPLTMGRLQVRIHGIHGEDQEQVPDENLPWAQVLTPVTEGGVTNLGNFLGIQIEARVFGIFLDGINSQQPLILGSIPHSVDSTSTGGQKTKVITNVMAQGTTSEFDVAKKTETEMIDEPLQKNLWKPVYPHNKVTQTPSGHVIEIDDTPPDSDGNRYERIHIYHRTGTFIEMQPNGDVVTQHKNGFRSVTGNDKLYASGDVDWVIEGNITFSSLKNISFNAKENFTVISEGTQDYSSKGNYSVNSTSPIDIKGTTIDLNKTTPGVLKDFEWAGVQEPKDATAGGSSENPTEEDTGEQLGPSSSGGPMKGEGKSGTALQSEPGDCTRKDLGSTSAKFESNNKPGAIGKDSTGGYSYGSYQIATKVGTMDTFMDYIKDNPKYSKYHTSLNNAGGSSAATSGSTEFKNEWKSLARDPDFGQAQHDFIQRSHHDPAVTKIKNSTGIDVCDGTWSNGVQDAVWSTAVQHGTGGANTIVQRALARTGKTSETVTDEELITAIYDERGANNGTKYFPSSTSNVRDSVVNRFKSEKTIALANSIKPSADEGVNIMTSPAGPV